MEHRLNARLEADLARKLERLRRMTGKSVTAIVKAALEAYYDRLHDGKESAREVLESCGFVGCADGGPNLSTGYKAALRDSLAKKA